MGLEPTTSWFEVRRAIHCATETTGAATKLHIFFGGTAYPIWSEERIRTKDAMEQAKRFDFHAWMCCDLSFLYKISSTSVWMHPGSRANTSKDCTSGSKGPRLFFFFDFFLNFYFLYKSCSFQGKLKGKKTPLFWPNVGISPPPPGGAKRPRLPSPKTGNHNWSEEFRTVTGG